MAEAKVDATEATEAEAADQVVAPEATVVETEVAAPVDSTEVLEAPAPRKPVTCRPASRVPRLRIGWSPGAEAPTNRPRVRAHNTSFFGARRARDVAAVEPAAEVTEVTEPAPVVEEPTRSSSEETVGRRVAEATEETTEIVAAVEVEHEVARSRSPAGRRQVEQAQVERSSSRSRSSRPWPSRSRSSRPSSPSRLSAEAHRVAQAEPARRPAATSTTPPSSGR